MKHPDRFKHFAASLGFFLLISFYGMSQGSISGTIKDSAGNTISGANISIIYMATGAGIDFKKSDEKGYYYFAIPDTIHHAGLAIKVNAIGFVKLVKPIKNIPSVIDFLLIPFTNELPRVIVKNSDTKFKIKGDTLNYTASDFADKSDRSIGDVIRKIPGIEIDDNGTIKYQGKAINYFYIDGDNILDDKYTIATKNLPPEIVEKIQVIENNQHIKMLNGIVPSEQPALNITLKDKSKTNFIHTAKMGAGTETTKEAEINSLAFRSRFKAINIAKYNNSGSDPVEEIVSHNAADFANAVESRVADNLLNLGLAGSPSIKKNRFLFNDAALFNINDFVKTKKGLSLRANAYYLSDKQDQSYHFLSTYYLPSDTIRYTEQQQTQRDIQTLHAVFNANINSEKQYLNNSITVEYTTHTDIAQLATNTQTLQQNLKSPTRKISNSFNGIKLLPNRKFIEYFSFISYDTKAQDLFVSPGLHTAFLNNNQPFAQTIQQVSAPSFFTNNYVSYKLSKNNVFQSYKIGFQLQDADINSDLSLKQNNNTITSLPDSFSNRLNWKKNKFYTEAEYRLEEGRNSIRVTVPAGYHSIKYADTGLQKSESINAVIVTPSVLWKYRAGRENIATAGYNYSTRLSNIGELLPGIIMENYQSFSTYNLPIQQTHTHSFNAAFDFRKSVKLLFINISANYAESKAGFLYSSTLKNNIMQKMAVPFENTRYSSSVSAGISKYLFSLKTNISARYTFQQTQSQQLLNNRLFSIAYLSSYFSAAITVKPSSYLSLNFESSHTWSFSKPNNNPISQFISQKIYHSKQVLELVLLPSDRFSFRFRNEYYRNSQTGQATGSFLFSDVSVRYRLLKKSTDLELSCTNITNSSFFTSLYVSDNSISESKYFLRPRTVFLRVSIQF